ncbi:PAAR domain-containing protein [Herbaspirillum seropedicae]|uniref:PAAR domain-containing protein n=1 Tax=Herbaspirillum seropedicae TaxID=964 RepID=UPI0011209E75|nr:PAAR domain-containing protein [Herbaspirillum seropedicae]MDR6398446.1 putative Zn-binding protein involved in type VI secretion [Herbaspirillum seropedicae]QDD63443.1 PAAR domain-containing protein [Herbaspirillum seropedicae]
MAAAIIRLGDPTSHGGRVITASTTHLIGGLGVARVGDKVMCPLPGHGVNAIIEGAPSFQIDGRSVALHGQRAACGCTLVSTLATATHG